MTETSWICLGCGAQGTTDLVTLPRTFVASATSTTPVHVRLTTESCHLCVPREPLYASAPTGRALGKFADLLRKEPVGDALGPIDYSGLELRIVAHEMLREVHTFTREQPRAQLHALSSHELRLALVLALGKDGK